MASHKQFLVATVVFLLLLAPVVMASVTGDEIEPNDTPAQANPLALNQPLTGSITSTIDIDYYKIEGKSNYKAVVAYLDATPSDPGAAGLLTMYGPDGTTILQQDETLVAWEHFVTTDPHYLRVSEQGQDQNIETYKIKYHEVQAGAPGNEPSEQEPNDLLTLANTAAGVNRGTISSSSDSDCYAMNAQAGDVLQIVVNGDPDHHGGTDPKITVHNYDGSVWSLTNDSGPGGSEITHELNVTHSGTYTYCVSAESGAGPDATYLAGGLVNGEGYKPEIERSITWSGNQLDGIVPLGEPLSITATVHYDGPLEIPDSFDVGIRYDPNKLQPVPGEGNPDDYKPGLVLWHLPTLSPGQPITVTTKLQVIAPTSGIETEAATPSGSGEIAVDVISEYYILRWTSSVDYVAGQGFHFYLPLIKQ